ncbi:hypothetical protein SAMN05421852_10659 [Thermoflavimicrobium dichotomicum]|uniref:YlxP-like protein n=1 Tax=Thermoflavimicrobium dichotomicum TaxID=46223 RepID=A0A1I3PPU0_9BACL|nr:hypothetical protein SAMN05421852_10659 [Thermoflavimicrobium dichotomicum]
MVVGLLECEGWVMSSTSLKDKRRVIQSALTRLRNKFNLSVAEVGKQDDRQMTALAVAGVGSSKQLIEKELQQALRLLEETDGLEIIHAEVTFM